MNRVGELRDQKMANDIVAGLLVMGIPASVHYESAEDMYVLTVSEVEFLAPATDFYRVKLGIKKPLEIDQEWVKIKTIPRQEITYAMLVLSVVLYVMSFANFGDELYSALSFGKTDSSLFYEIKRGQLWRIITPIFLHMSFMHILFNMLWFKDLGYLIEKVFGKSFLIKFVVVSAVVSNTLQYCVSGPQFGGMSGVLYAMLGFIWVHKLINSKFEFSLPRYDIIMMIGWYFLCLTGLLGPIANTAHGAGLVVGILSAVIYEFKWDKVHLQFFSLGVFFLIFTLAVEGYKLAGRYFILLLLQ
jgi:GlpG protein